MPERGRALTREPQVEITEGVEYGTDRPMLIGRIEESNGRVTLACAYLDVDEGWFPTWLGRTAQESCRVPDGWRLSDEMITTLQNAVEALTALSGVRLDDGDHHE